MFIHGEIGNTWVQGSPADDEKCMGKDRKHAMTHVPYHRKLVHAYLMYMVFRETFTPVDDLEDYFCQFELDWMLLLLIQKTRYLHGRPRFLKLETCTWHGTMPKLLKLIQHHEVVWTTFTCPQAPVETQLAVTLYHMGQLEMEPLYQIWLVLQAYQRIVWRNVEKEMENKWVERASGCVGWRDGWLMYDGTPIDLFQKPGLNGDVYWHRMQVWHKHSDWECTNQPAYFRLFTWDDNIGT
ncbi:hypothetical protein JB92DRAFT_2824438 [Gautieria morchelliformis]|nr:hypothetical protein JB92DRAFT_2824438 [Gautieria morchelliformis]